MVNAWHKEIGYLLELMPVDYVNSVDNNLLVPRRLVTHTINVGPQANSNKFDE